MGLFQSLSDPLKKRDKLTKNDNLPTFFDDLRKFFQKLQNLPALFPGIIRPRQQPRIAGNLSKAGEKRKDTERFLAHRFRQILTEPVEAFPTNPHIFVLLTRGKRRR